MQTTNIIVYESPNDSTSRGPSVDDSPVLQKNYSDAQAKVPHILFITSFPPRECGIATYSQDLINAMNNQFTDSFKCIVCALEPETEKHDHPHQPEYILNTDCHNSYIKTAFYINKNQNIKLVVIQHEFGFFANH